MSPALTFAVYAIISATTHDSSLLTGQAFTSVSLIALLTTPLNQLVQAAPQLLACSACAGRIQEYLEQPQKETPENMSFGILPQRLDNNTKENLPGLADVTEKQATPPSAFLVEHATFQWPSASAPALRDINLEVPTGTIGILAGPIGSGKSSLLQSILGNTMIVKGSVSRAPISLSYCSQNPWLISGTIYENITMGSSYDPDWYQYTLWACSLDRDIRKLPMADLTQVGSKGAGLSGGQKQRVVCLPGLKISSHSAHKFTGNGSYGVFEGKTGSLRRRLQRLGCCDRMHHRGPAFQQRWILPPAWRYCFACYTLSYASPIVAVRNITKSYRHGPSPCGSHHFAFGRRVHS